jgi:hypothetical protein
VRIAQDLLTRLTGTPTTPASFEDPITRRTVVVARVIASDRHSAGPRVLLVDADVENLPLSWSEIRLVRAPDRDRGRLYLIVRHVGRDDITENRDVIAVYLPRDVATGDLLALPLRSGVRA